MYGLATRKEGCEKMSEETGLSGISSTTFIAGLVAAILVSSSLSTVIATQWARGPQGETGPQGIQGIQGVQGEPAKEVNVTNLPLDEQGNLKVSNSKNVQVINVFKDLNVTFKLSGMTDYLSNSIEVGDFNEIYIYVSMRYWTATSWGTSLSWPMFWFVKGTVDGIGANSVIESGSQSFRISGPYNGKPVNGSSRYLVWAPSIQIEIESRPLEGVTGPGPGPFNGWALVSVSLYLKS